MGKSNPYSNTHKNETENSYLFEYVFCFCFFGLLVHLYSIANIFFVYVNDSWRLFAIVLWVSYFIANTIVTYAFRSLSNNGSAQNYSLIFTVGLWSLMAIHLYGIQELENYSYYQNIYIKFIWVQVCGMLFCSIRCFPVGIRTSCVFLSFLILGGGLIYWLYVCFFQQAAPYLMWPGVALFFSGCLSLFIMILFDSPSVEEVQEEEEEEKEKTEEIVSNETGRGYGVLCYPAEGGRTSYLPYGEKTFEEIEFLYVENSVRYFCRMNTRTEKEMKMYKENGQWYCQTSGQEPIRVLLRLRHPEKEWQGFEINKREYLKRAIQYRLEVPHFVALNDSDIDESFIQRRE